MYSTGNGSGSFASAINVNECVSSLRNILMSPPENSIELKSFNETNNKSRIYSKRTFGDLNQKCNPFVWRENNI